MHRCFVSPASWNAPDIRLTEEEEHHLLDVLRAQPGDRVTIFDGQGREALAQIFLSPRDERGSRRSQRGIALKVVEAVRTVRSVIVPVITERVVVRLSDRQKDERRNRWQRIVLSAAKQCQTNWIPDIKPVCAFPDAVRWGSKADLFLVGALTPEARPLRTVLQEAGAGKGLRGVALLVGPEGDLTPAELAEAGRAGAVPVSFGSVVLRVETAALFGLSVLASTFLTGAKVGA